MNPFDLRGPQFLAFYAALMVATWIAMSLVRRMIDASSEDRPAALGDPYLIALLRGGPKEMARVAIVSLLDRGLLDVTAEGVATSRVGRTVQVRRTIERMILAACHSPLLLSSLSESPNILAECEKHEAELQEMGYLPSGMQRASRGALLFGGAGFLAAVSATKIVIALSRGRTNILFLVLLTALAVWIAAVIAIPRPTRRGQRHLAELRNFFQALKLRGAQIQPGGGTSELAMLAAVYGGSGLSADQYPWLTILYPRPQPSSSSSSSSCSSSSCSSSSCGGGCGGGGCGGCGS